MSFTTGSLFHRESVELAALFLDQGEWNAVRDKVLYGNLLQARTLNTLKRVCQEIKKVIDRNVSREIACSR